MIQMRKADMIIISHLEAMGSYVQSIMEACETDSSRKDRLIYKINIINRVYSVQNTWIIWFIRPRDGLSLSFYCHIVLFSSLLGIQHNHNWNMWDHWGDNLENDLTIINNTHPHQDSQVHICHMFNFDDGMSCFRPDCFGLFNNVEQVLWLKHHSAHEDSPICERVEDK